MKKLPVPVCSTSDNEPLLSQNPIRELSHARAAPKAARWNRLLLAVVTDARRHSVEYVNGYLAGRGAE